MRSNIVFFLALPASFGWGFSRPAFLKSALQKTSPSFLFSSKIDKDDETSTDTYLTDFFASECDDMNLPPSLSIILKSIKALASGSDIRGRFVDHARLGNPAAIAHAISEDPSNLPALTPFAAHCLGYAFATMLKQDCPEIGE